MIHPRVKTALARPQNDTVMATSPRALYKTPIALMDSEGIGSIGGQVAQTRPDGKDYVSGFHRNRRRGSALRRVPVLRLWDGAPRRRMPVGSCGVLLGILG